MWTAGLMTLGLALAAPQDAVRDTASVVGAERAFAADGAALGISGSFNKWAAPDAIVIGGQGVQRVPDAYPPAPRPADEPLLEWWPNYAGAARSGDLGFTTGAVQVGGRRGGHYFTIWTRQASGEWRWVYDGGSGASSIGAPGPSEEPLIMSAATGSSVSADVAMAEVRAVELALASVARTDQAAAHLAHLSAAGRVYVAPMAPAVGPGPASAALRTWPAAFEFGPTEGGGASRAGDLAWTYGVASWTREGVARRGYYLRLWRKEEATWRIMLAQLIPMASLQPVQ
ncbi:MAG: hypothetical protein EON90_05445 [Brevundimonas sp.]|nr:MAG: hypothetical protein EON90_05445 [Brevundimonas sp.]